MNESIIVKEYEFIKPIIHKIDSIIDNSIRDCYNNFFHTFGDICEYDIKFADIGNSEKVNITISDNSMKLNELNRKIKTARENGFVIYQKKITMQIYGNLSIKKYTIIFKITNTNNESSIFQNTIS